MSKVLCQINDIGFTEKPTDNRVMGKLRERMIQQGWQHLSEPEFVYKVTHEGFPFYGCLFNGHDLMETGQQRLCWKAQTMIAVDVDKTTVDPMTTVQTYQQLGLSPWLAYTTFSDGKDGLRSYRLLWKVQVDLNISYEQWHAIIKAINLVTPLGDKHAQDCTRMWQGSLSETPVFWQPNAHEWSYQELTEHLKLT